MIYLALPAALILALVVKVARGNYWNAQDYHQPAWRGEKAPGVPRWISRYVKPDATPDDVVEHRVTKWTQGALKRESER